jgi:hypothetical protein
MVKADAHDLVEEGRGGLVLKAWSNGSDAWTIQPGLSCES